MTDLVTDEIADLSKENKITFETLGANPNEYEMILFGDNLDPTEALKLFDSADTARVPMLGIGTLENENPLGAILADDGRYALATQEDCCSDAMQVDVTAQGQGHAIFYSIDTATTLIFEDEDWDWGDEQYYDLSGPGGEPPVDWTVLAMLGAVMGWAGEAAIVEFTTASGTRVMLDGSANTGDEYLYWTQTRWDILYNQVTYLMGQ